jgi:REP element-mobilizing transposase RayT
MPRRPRVQLAGGVYHVTQRATDRELLFLDDVDRVGFLHLLARTVLRYRWELHDYCLMSNHFHLLVRTLEPSIARGMQYLNARHVEAFNSAHGRRGTLVQGRYYGGLVESDEHFLQVRGYLALNPVDAGLCREPEEWPWGAYGAAGQLCPPRDMRLERFVADYRNRRRRLAAMALRDTAGL